jgi:hypothetical protein
MKGAVGGYASNVFTPIADALPRMEALGPHIYTHFPVQPYKAAQIVWLNVRWFLSVGIDILADEIRHEVSTLLLETFGVVATGGAPASEHCADSVRYLSADRYGRSKGTLHGGSGRCGAYGGFNAKGIGRTPLAADNVDWDHNHGYLWLHEAIREAINAEVANAELPYGAVPVVAIIDTGVDFQRDPDSPVERRAIVVRPNFVRPAHFERSILFGGAGTESSEQYLDALRVRDAILLVTKNRSRMCDANICFDTVEKMLTRFSRQLGYGRAHRLWQGDFLSSNLSIDGALADFGAFRAVQNWQRAMGLPGQYFGNDRGAFNQFLESMIFYFGKYGGKTFDGRALKVLKEESADALSSAFKDGCLSALSVVPADNPALAAELSALFQAYFETQQMTRFQVGRHSRSVWRRPWLYDFIGTDAVLYGGTQDARAAKNICLLVLQSAREAGIKDRTALNALRRWLRPRPRLYYEIAHPHSVAFCHRIIENGVPNSKKIERYIDGCISRSRRVWPGAPRTLHVVAQTCISGSSALYGLDDRTGKMRAWVQGLAVGADFVAFRQKVPLDNMASVIGPVCGQIGVLGDIHAVDDWSIVIRLDRTEIRVPHPIYHYEPSHLMKKQ